MKLKLLAAAAAMTVGLAAAGSAGAVVTSITFDSLNDSGQIFLDGFGGDPPAVVAGLTSDVTYTLTGHTGTDWTFSYLIHNTSGAPILTSRVSMIGFDVDPNVIGGANGLVIINGVLPNEDQNGNTPNHGNTEICITGNNCAGGANDGVTQGGTGGGSFTLRFASDDLTQITFNNFVDRYQSITGAGNVTSAIGRPAEGGGGGGAGGVPEPATWALMIGGFGGVGALMRRRRMAVA
jgi:hypothetical protein